MKPFESLTFAGQSHRLRQLAVKALRTYGLGTPHLTLLQHEGNTTFRIDLANGERYMLRIQYPGLRTIETVQSEMMWLAAIRQETDFIVPEPLITRDGNRLTVTSITGVPEPRICVLFHWIDGRFLDARLTPSHMERVGALTAGLQAHGAAFRPPEGFVRGRLDNLTEAARRIAARGTSEALARQQVDSPADEEAAIRLVSETCSPEDGMRVAVLIGNVRDIQRKLGQERDTFGLIHGDLHQENYLFHKDQVGAIDFDDCGFGYYLYDLAVTLSEVNWRKDTPALRKSFLKGYRRGHELSSRHEEYLDAFITFRDLQIMIWKIEMRNHPAFRGEWASSVKETLQDIKNFVER